MIFLVCLLLLGPLLSLGTVLYCAVKQAQETRNLKKMNEHHLKTWPPYFDAIKDGSKPFEVRKEDGEPFELGDTLVLHEFVPCSICNGTGDLSNDLVVKSCGCLYTDNPKGRYTDDILVRSVTFVLKGGEFGIEAGYVVMGLKEDAS